MFGFTLALDAATAAAFPFGLIAGFLISQARHVPSWVALGAQITELLAAAVVF